MARITEQELLEKDKEYKDMVELVNSRYTSFHSMLARYVEQERNNKGNRK